MPRKRVVTHVGPTNPNVHVQRPTVTVSATQQLLAERAYANSQRAGGSNLAVKDLQNEFKKITIAP